MVYWITSNSAWRVANESAPTQMSNVAGSCIHPPVLVLQYFSSSGPNWKVTVAGQPAGLLRANFIVRGVFLDKPGEHRVEFKFQPPLTGPIAAL